MTRIDTVSLVSSSVAGSDKWSFNFLQEGKTPENQNLQKTPNDNAIKSFQRSWKFPNK